MDNFEEKYFLTRGKAILFGLILLIVIVVLIVFKVKQLNSENKYKEFEDELVAAAENYAAIKGINLEEGEQIKITKKVLIKNKLIYNDLKNKCDAYVIISSEDEYDNDEYNIFYRSYIKCGDKYYTPNYDFY